MIRILTLLFSFVALQVLSAPKAELWTLWAQSNEANQTVISHDIWQATLDKYLIVENQSALFAYEQVTEVDKNHLTTYLDALSQIDPRTYSKAEQYAYWVNLYNALTVHLVLEAYPIKSITKLGGLFSFGPWEDEVITVAETNLTLNDIEHRILRPIWQDPRTHYAVNCASIGCPNLQAVAFSASNTESLLNQAAKTFINSAKGVKTSHNTLELSSIYDWFSDDFGSQAMLFEHINMFRTIPVNSEWKIEYGYDWTLNDAK